MGSSSSRNDSELTFLSLRSPTGSLPYIELNEKLLTQSYPVLRYLARELGKYDGKTSEEKYFADVSQLLPFRYERL